jgi:hypothetical protein
LFGVVLAFASLAFLGLVKGGTNLWFTLPDDHHRARPATPAGVESSPACATASSTRSSRRSSG